MLSLSHRTFLLVLILLAKSFDTDWLRSLRAISIMLVYYNDLIIMLLYYNDLIIMLKMSHGLVS